MLRKKSTLKHIEIIWPQLAQRLRDEYVFAVSSVDNAKIAFRTAIESGVGHTLFSPDGGAVAIMIWQDDQRGVSTSFAATEGFFTREYVQPFRDYIDEFQKLRHNAEIVSHSFSEHPKVVGWFESLKFKLEEGNGIHRVFFRAPRVDLN